MTVVLSLVSAAHEPLLAAAVPDESPVARTRRARRMYRALHERYPYAHCELDFTTPLELLVATILSAQTTDQRVNMVTPHALRAVPRRRRLRRGRPRPSWRR